MLRRIALSTAALVLALATTGVAGQAPSRAGAPATLRSLPAGDILMTFDLDRAVNRSLPTWMGDPETARRINKALEDVQTSTGVDLHRVREMAVSVRLLDNAES